MMISSKELLSDAYSSNRNIVILEDQVLVPLNKSDIKIPNEERQEINEIESTLYNRT